MSTTRRGLAPKGRLPARVYWVRRGLVVGVALVLVFAIAHVLAAFGGADTEAPRATVAAHHTADDLPDHQPGVVLTPRGGASVAATSGPLSQPTGACQDADVLVRPAVTSVPGGQRTTRLAMVLTTSSDTCTWHVSSRTLAVKITAGATRLWSSQDCPSAVRDQQVVVRPADEPATKIHVLWHGHRSTAGCTTGQRWVGPGFYHLVAASLGGEPSDVQFRLAVPPRPVVTKTPKATKKASATPSKKPSRKPSSRPTKTSD